ncbi:MAG: group I intron-associated PD-(D/E)XK endonuclease [Pyrinomonadaceae bacterium]
MSAPARKLSCRYYNSLRKTIDAAHTQKWIQVRHRLRKRAVAGVREGPPAPAGGGGPSPCHPIGILVCSAYRILAAFVAAGYFVSVPFGSGHKYDFVVDDSTCLFRVQCKTGRVKNGVLLFNADSQSGNGSVKMSYRGLADLFAVLNPADGNVYLMPVNEVGVTEVSLRLTPTLNKQAQGVRWIEFYLLKPLVLSGSGAMVAH